ncbi:hypothetical protein Tc00.1047053507095.20 [Trypanosoma cruzi]|uniref:Uncharacterized protein n=1 Tax=Trypanosoma cruzi (strain CL Brener) TaxID=353153 RepID=Q4CLQ1_TRYCC|nr:hypothetical protein Tc00.1047053507095.20 [Trypanosoma cruzi]EAN81204.1 hypothetical protein Tc00.1047053507095.20 [Trypanosoma cruzi]|eukprot:XP_802650.1 hypothetical protein [Trypanosoma cruzi strain CL Brener]
MAREHAATPRRNTAGKGERGKKQKAAQTHTEGTDDRRRKASPGASPRQPHAEADPHPSTTRLPEFTPPSRPQWFAALTPRGHTRCITPTEKETRNARSLSPPFPSCPLKEAAAARSCQHRVQRKHPPALQCVCPTRVAVCAHCHAQQSRKKRKNKKEKRRKASEGTRKHKCTAGVHGGKQWKIKQHSFKKKKKNFPSLTF